jgi:hypothetical protein
MQVLKSISAREMFRQFPVIRKELWGDISVRWEKGQRKRWFANTFSNKVPVEKKNSIINSNCSDNPDTPQLAAGSVHIKRVAAVA